jgi:hypothetical protein
MRQEQFGLPSEGRTGVAARRERAMVSGTMVSRGRKDWCQEDSEGATVSRGRMDCVKWKEKPRRLWDVHTGVEEEAVVRKGIRRKEQYF